MAKLEAFARAYAHSTLLQMQAAWEESAPSGQRCEAQKPDNYSTRERINLVAGLKPSLLLAPIIFRGYGNGNFFLEWLEKAFIPELSTGDTVILDIPPFHPKDRIITLLKDAGCKALFLPRHSPRNNLIEHAWFPIKYAHVKILATFTDINAALLQAIICGECLVCLSM